MTSAREPGMYDFLLIGGGVAAATAAAEIRARDAVGSIALVTDDSAYPYHRPPLSKEFLRGEIGVAGVYGAGGIYAREPTWYDSQRIEVIRGVEALRLDTEARTVLLATGQTVRYRQLLLATGGRARRLRIPGADLLGVHALRSLDDAVAIRAELTARQPHVVVIGSRFIGLETAASALMKGARVTIIDASPRLWHDLMPSSLADYFERHFQAHGARFRFGSTPTAFLPGPDGRVAAVQIAPTDGSAPLEEIPCACVVTGIGIELNTRLASAAGLALDERSALLVNERLETSAPGVFAAGDIITYPDPVAGRMHFEHWDHAIMSGRVAAINMTGGQETYRHLPYFFSDQFDLSLNMLGYPTSDADVVVRGDMARNRFTALYVWQGTLRAALMVNDDVQTARLRHLIASGVTLPGDIGRLRDPAFDLETLVSR